jgi:hypothetical protein
MKIIAIGHYKRVGKDSLANAIIRNCYELEPTFRVQKKSWAWKLKQICHELYAWAGLREPEFYETPDGELLREVVLPAIGKSPRQIWIDMGTDAVREKVYDKTWLHYLLKSNHDCDALIIPDTRFYNEVEGVTDAGGHLCKMLRPGFSPGKNRPDRQLIPFRGWHNVVLAHNLAEIDAQGKRYALWLLGRGPEPLCTSEVIELLLAQEVVEPWEPEYSQAI